MKKSHENETKTIHILGQVSLFVQSTFQRLTGTDYRTRAWRMTDKLTCFPINSIHPRLWGRIWRTVNKLIPDE